MKSALLKATALSAGIAASVTLAGLQPVSAAGFSGDYDPSFWGLGNFYSSGAPGGNGFVDDTTAPSSITIVGSDDGSGNQGNTFYGTDLAGSVASYVSFNWAYNSNDLNSTFDSFGIFFGANPQTATLVNLAGGVSGPAGPVNGSYSFLVNPGQFFGFYVETADNAYGEGFATISNFNVSPATTPVPTPALLPGLLAMGVAALRKKQAEAEESEV